MAIDNMTIYEVPVIIDEMNVLVRMTVPKDLDDKLFPIKYQPRRNTEKGKALNVSLEGELTLTGHSVTTTDIASKLAAGWVNGMRREEPEYNPPETLEVNVSSITRKDHEYALFDGHIGEGNFNVQVMSPGIEEGRSWIDIQTSDPKHGMHMDLTKEQREEMRLFIEGMQPHN